MSQKSYVHKPATKPMDYRTLAKLHDYHTGLHPQAEALVIYDSEGQRSVYTFQEVKDQSLEIAGLLLHMGITRGQRVALMAPNSIEFVSCFLALNRIGANAFLIPRYGTKDEVKFALIRFRCRAFLFFPSGENVNDQDIIQRARDVMDDDKIINVGPKEVIPNGSWVKSIKELLATMPKLNENQVYKQQDQIQFDDPAVVLFTSGSTGQPKAIQYTHHAVVNESFAVMMDWFGLSIDEVKSGRTNVRFINDRPFTYAACFLVSLNNVFAMGCTLVTIPTNTITKRVQSDFFLRVLQDEKCTHGFFFPYLIHDLIANQNVNKFDLKSLKTVVSGGQSIPKDHFIQLQKILPNCVLVYEYGMSEIMMMAAKAFEDAFSDSYDSLNINPSMEVKIIKENKEVVPVGEKGEICVRSRFSFSEYLEYSKEQEQCIASNGWIHTDDAGYIDLQGKLHVFGRMKEVIIRAADKIFPIEVEKVLSTHPDVKSVVVMGVPDERLNEEICACVIPKAGSGLESSVTEFEAWSSLQWEADDVGLTRTQKYTLVFQDFPSTKTGKIDRKALKAIAVQKLGLNGKMNK